MLHDLGERRHRADLEAAVGLLDAVQLFDLAQIDHDLWAAEAILQPVHAVETAREHERVRTVFVEQPDRIVDRCRLVEFKCCDDVAYHGHCCDLLKP